MDSDTKVETCTLLFHGMIGRSRVFGREGCTIALYGRKLDTGLGGGQFEEQRVATGFISSLCLWKGL